MGDQRWGPETQGLGTSPTGIDWQHLAILPSLKAVRKVDDLSDDEFRGLRKYPKVVGQYVSMYIYIYIIQYSSKSDDL